MAFGGRVVGGRPRGVVCQAAGPGRGHQRDSSYYIPIMKVKDESGKHVSFANHEGTGPPRHRPGIVPVLIRTQRTSGVGEPSAGRVYLRVFVRLSVVGYG